MQHLTSCLRLYQQSHCKRRCLFMQCFSNKIHNGDQSSHVSKSLEARNPLWGFKGPWNRLWNLRACCCTSLLIKRHSLCSGNQQKSHQHHEVKGYKQRSASYRLIMRLSSLKTPCTVKYCMTGGIGKSNKQLMSWMIMRHLILTFMRHLYAVYVNSYVDCVKWVAWHLQ